MVNEVEIIKRRAGITEQSSISQLQTQAKRIANTGMRNPQAFANQLAQLQGTSGIATALLAYGYVAEQNQQVAAQVITLLARMQDGSGNTGAA